MIISKEIIEELYINQLKAGYIVCKELGIPSNVLDSYLYEFGIPKRSQSEAALLAYREKRGLLPHGSRKPITYKTIPKDQLELYYVAQEMNIEQVAKRLGVGQTVVSRELKRYGLMRSKIEQDRVSLKTRRKNHPPEKMRCLGEYILIYNPNHPRSHQSGYVCEHIVVWEQYHGKSLPDNWVVHHLNGEKHDNQIENLIGLPKGKHHCHMLSNALSNRIVDLERLLEKRLSGVKSIPYQRKLETVELEQQQFAFMD